MIEQFITATDGRLSTDGSQGGELVLGTERIYLAHLFDRGATIFYSASDARAGHVNWVEVISGDSSMRYRILHGDEIDGVSSFQVHFIRGEYQGKSEDIFTTVSDIEAFTICARIIADIEGLLRNSSIHVTSIAIYPEGPQVISRREYMNVMLDRDTTIRYRITSDYQLMWMQVESSDHTIRFIITSLDVPLHYRVVIVDEDGIREDIITYEDDRGAFLLCLSLKMQLEICINERYTSSEP